MAFTVEDFDDMLRILEAKPEWQDRMRQVILTRELLELPARFAQLQDTVRELAEAQRRTEQRVEELTEAQRRTEQRVEELAEAQRRTEQRVEELAEAQRRTEQRVEELAEAQRRTEQRVEELAEAQRRTEQRVEELAASHQSAVAEIRELRASLEEMRRIFNERLESLERWQQGETGRRKGERFQRETVARAPVLFFGGTGGSPAEPQVRTQVGRWLRPYFQQGYEVPDWENPLLSDLIWWKRDKVLVVEIGVKISKDDVLRAKARANTLRQAGIDATPVVVGEEWGTPEIEATAQQEGVEWYVRGGLSAGFLEFRRLEDGLD